MAIRDRIKDFRRVKGRDLLPNPRNWRRHPQAQRDAMRAILEEVGFAGAALARETPAGLMLIDGHLRAEIEPDAELPVLVVDVDDAEAAKLLATFDPLGKMAESDPDALGKLLAEIDTESEALGKLLNELAAEVSVAGLGGGVEDPEPQIDRAAELQKRWKTKLGQVWEVPGKAGVHRVMCGDSTKAEDVRRLLGGAEADLVATDPPYGIKAERMTMGDKESSKPKKVRLSSGQAWDAFRPRVVDLLAMAPKVCIWGAQYFCHQLPISDDWLTWSKKIAGVSFAEFELAWTNFGCRGRLFAHHWSGEEKVHITQKPLAVIQWVIGLCPGHPHLIYDPFLGSGTTLIAAEQLGRVCYGMEISEAYTAVILQRAKDAGLSPLLSVF